MKKVILIKHVRRDGVRLGGTGYCGNCGGGQE